MSASANYEAGENVSTLIALAQTLSREAERLDRYLKESGSQQPTFAANGPLEFPTLDENAQKSRQEVIRASKELYDLCVGPTEQIRWLAWSYHDNLSLHAIYKFGIAKSFPSDSTATFGEIAEKVNVDEVNVRRLLRHAMTNRIFTEVSPGVVAHTAASRALAEVNALEDWVGFCADDMFVAAANTVNAMIQNPGSQEPTQTGFCYANSTTDVEPMFVTMGKNPERARRFGGAMASLTGGEGYEVQYAIDNYDWAAIDSHGGTVVDVGGSHGFVCVALAEKFKNINFVVQDLPRTIASAPKLEDNLAKRLKFMAHDFNTEQPVKGADVYFWRWIFHNQSDKYSINILRQLIPAMKKGSKVLINDHCLPEPNVESLWDEKIIRTMDLTMLTLLNARERSEGDFRELFKAASPQYRFIGTTRPKGCRMTLVEAVWEGEDYGGAASSS